MTRIRWPFIAAWAAASALAASVSPATAQITVLDQIPKNLIGAISAHVSDAACVSGIPVTRVIAEDFVVAAPVALRQVQWLGLYEAATAPSDPVPFVLRLHANSPGELPDALLADLAGTRTQELYVPATPSLSIHLFTATFDAVTVNPGTYWLEIYEIDDSTQNCAGLLHGPSDPARGRIGTAADENAAPGVNWVARPANDPAGFAVRILGGIPEQEALPIPTLGGGALAGFVTLLAATACLVMRRRRVRRPRSFPTLLALVAGLASSSRFAAAQTAWPGSGGCSTTLQACIDSVAAGETIQVMTNTAVTEDLEIAKSLVLEPGPGIGAALVGEILLESGPAPTVITLRDFGITGLIRAVVQQGDLEVHVTGNRITHTVDDRSAIELVSNTQLDPAGNLIAEVRDNDITTNGSAASDSCGGVRVIPATSPETRATITDNTVFAGQCNQGDGIVVANGPGRFVSTDILRNFVLVPGSAHGLVLENTHAGEDSALIARVIDNVVSGERGAVGALILDSEGGVLNMQLINNTFAHNLAGVLIIANPGQPLTGLVANNIVAFSDEDGLRIGADGVTNRNNLVFGNAVDPFTPGPDTVFADPRFVGEDDFRVQSGSPAIDAGDDDALQSDITTDIVGAPRIQGARIDIGAFEGAGGAAPAVVPTLSQLGLGLLAVLVVGAGLALLRRS
jgi:hypothetical protein